ncbi:MAG TPA: hypothetical protein V6C97_37260 [Oculatellaceae cyanobacterium]
MQLFLNPSHVKPIRIEVSGIPATEADSVAVSFVRVGPRSALSEVQAIRVDNGLKWIWDSFWIESMRVHATKSSLQKISQISIQIGDKEQAYAGDSIRAWQKIEPEGWFMPSAKEPLTSMVVPWPLEGLALNLPSADELLLYAAMPGLLIAAIFLIVFAVIARARERAWYSDLIERLFFRSLPAIPGFNPISLGSGLLIVVVGLVMFSRLQPFAFTQDDNFCQFLPVIVRSSETLLQGRLPVWNPYQLLGAPTMTVGTYALTYPLTYLSYLFAHYISKNDSYTLEVFCIGHLLAGYFAMSYALRRARLSPPLATAGAVCWALSGWFLIGGRSQYNFTPYAVFLPLLVDAINRLIEQKVGWKWVAWTGLLLGVLFHAGHAELWLYTACFFSLAIVLLILTRKLDRVKVCLSVATLLFGSAIASPLALLQVMETGGISRQGGVAWSVDVLPMLLPLGTLGCGGTTVGGADYRYGNELCYCGTLFTLASLASIAIWLGTLMVDWKLLVRRSSSTNIWLICGGIAFVLCLGAPGILWSLLSFMPIFNKFRWSIKYLPFAQMFFLFGGGIILERYLPERTTLKYALAASVAGLTLLHVTLCRTSFYTFADRPYPELAPAVNLVAHANQSRLYSATPFRSPNPDFVQALPLDFPTYYKALAFTGYDTFVSSRPEYEKVSWRLYKDTTNAAKAYGIGALLWSDALEHPQLSGNKFSQIIEVCAQQTLQTSAAIRALSKQRQQAPGCSVYAIDQPQPIAFNGDNPAQPLAYEIDQSGIRLSLRGQKENTSVTLNFLHWPWMHGEIDGHEAPLASDKWDRIVFKAPPGDHMLFVGYRPPWLLTCGIGLLQAVVSLIFTLWAYRLQSVQSKVSLQTGE